MVKMTDPNETGKTGASELNEIINQAKEEVKKEVEAAKTDDEKKALGKKIKEEIDKIKLTAEEVVEDERAIKEGRQITRQKTEEGKHVLYTFTRAIEAVKQGLPAEYISSTKEGAVILQKLAEAGVDFTPSTSAAITFYLSDFLFGEKRISINLSDQAKSDFQKSLEGLCEVNEVAARYILDSLEKAFARGELTNLSEEQLNFLRNELQNKLNKEKAGDLKGRKPVMSLAEIKELEQITHQVASLLSQKFANKEIDLSKADEINKALITSKLSEDSKTALISLGLPADLVEKYAQLKEKYFQFPDFSYLKGWAPALVPILEEAQEEFRDLSRFYSTSLDRGSLALTREMRLKFSDLIKKYYYLILKSVHADRSKSFHENYSHHTEVQYALSILRQIVSLSCEKVVEILPRESSDPQTEELINFFKDKGESFQSRIFTYASLFHDLPLYVRNLGSIEKIKEFFSFLFPSQIAEFFDDETGFMQMARDVLTMKIREYLVEGKNQYRGDFLSGKYTEEGVRWSQWFREEYRKKIKELGEKFGLIKKEDEWKLDMVVSYAEGVGIATLIDGEVLSTSDPVAHFKEVHPLMSFLSPKHNWMGGRGRDAPGKIAKFLLHTDIKLFPEVRPWIKRLWSKKKWAPEEFAEWVDKAIKTYGDKVLEAFFDVGGAYQELLGLFNLPNSINSWNGWRIEGMMPGDLKKVLDVLSLGKYGEFWKDKNLTLEEFTSQWRQIVFHIGQLYGTSGIWLSIGGPVGGAGVNRLNSELKRLVLDYYHGDVDLADFYFNEFFDEQKRNFGNRGRERIFQLKDRSEKLSLFEIRQIRQNQLRGEAFFRYLRRNPADFLMITTQLCPELLDDEGFVFKSEEEIKNSKTKTRLEKEQILGRQKELRIRWGEHFETLRKLHQFLLEKKGGKSIVEFIKEFNEAMITGYARHKTREEKIRREIIRIASDGKISEGEKKQKIDQLIKQINFLSNL
jgi:hypothetical protein